MCKFNKVLVEKEVEEKQKEYMDNHGIQHRIFQPIQVAPNLVLSIQASYAHYCTPRETLKDLDNYTHWEFALVGEDDFVSVKSVLPDFPSLAELELYFEGSVYCYVPTDLVDELYIALQNY